MTIALAIIAYLALGFIVTVALEKLNFLINDESLFTENESALYPTINIFWPIAFLIIICILGDDFMSKKGTSLGKIIKSIYTLGKNRESK